MTIEEIRANAPSDATHYHVYNVPVFREVEYVRFANRVRQIWNHYFNEWMDDIMDNNEQPDSEFKPL